MDDTMRTNDHHPILSKKRETKVILLLLEIEVQNELIRRGLRRLNQKLKTVLLATITISITYLLMKFPDQSLEASIRGLNMWWEIVFPSLLPFFVTAELLIGFGVVSFIGVLFEPIMRPLFNVPGEGSFAWIMGMASGYPSGAKISTRL